ncbi:MAG: DNRLRE domain-containing protein [Myxococcales bacterium]|nr:DNRLRE domain-containing protein [Myxococcales bacterium]MDP3499079.1 DNRLRE domain-containing protein [Myxococcales bacterium]
MSAKAVCLALVLLSTVGWAGGPRRVTIQRGVNGTVRDCYIWQEAPAFNGNSDTLTIGKVGATDKRTFLFFDLSGIDPTAVVQDARIVLQNTGTSGAEIRLHEVTAPWMETEPVWMTFGDAWKPEVVGQFTPVAGRNFVDVTEMVQKWLSGRPNNGVVMIQDTLTSSSTFDSSDVATVSIRPALEVIIAPAPPQPGALVTSQVPALEAACGVDFTYPLKAHAPDARTFTTTGAPDGLLLDEVTGVITWNSTPAARGEHSFTVTASDSSRTEDLPITLSVDCRGPLKVGFGCSASPGALAVLALLLFARRRR